MHGPMEEITNRVKNSGIITLDLGDLLPTKPVVEIDIQNQLWQGLVLREKDFREYLSREDWSRYAGQHCAIFCSTDAIVPTWAYMLVAEKLTRHSAHVYFGNKSAYLQQYCVHQIAQLDPEKFSDARVVIKGCADVPQAEPLFVALTAKLVPVVKSLMYGEPCSTVPIYKRPKE
jgi:hypothetical protein